MKVNTIHCGDALSYLRTLPDGCVDACISDPPYAEVDRDYGRLSEDDWMTLMKAVTLEVKRIVKPTGSAMFVLQPNFEKLGKMRLWLWRYLLWAAEAWNLIQDAYWWNHTTLPMAGASSGLMRGSVKYCIWLGAPVAKRYQEAVLWRLSDSIKMSDLSDRALHYHTSGASVRGSRMTEIPLKKGGSTPFNILPIHNTNSVSSAGAYGHGAGTPEPLVRWWVRYLTKPSDVVLDPFMGSGTTALVARAEGRDFLGCDLNPKYVAIAEKRLAQPYTPRLFYDDEVKG